MWRPVNCFTGFQAHELRWSQWISEVIEHMVRLFGIGTPLGVVTLVNTLSLLGQAAAAQTVDPHRFAERSVQQVADAEAKCRESGALMLTSADGSVQRWEMLKAWECPDTGAALLASRWKQL